MSDIARTNSRVLGEIEKPFTAQNESIGQVTSSSPNQYHEDRVFNNESVAAGAMGPQSWLAITVCPSSLSLKLLIKMMSRVWFLATLLPKKLQVFPHH